MSKKTIIPIISMNDYINNLADVAPDITNDDWVDLPKIVDGDEATFAYVYLKSTNFEQKKLNLNLDLTSHKGTITNANLIVNARQSSSNVSRKIILKFYKNGTEKIDDEAGLTTTATNYNFNITNYLEGLEYLTLAGSITSTTSTTCYIYEMYLEIDYIPEEGGEDEVVPVPPVEEEPPATPTSNIFLGTNLINNIMYGTKQILKVCLGSQELYSSTEKPSTPLINLIPSFESSSWNFVTGATNLIKNGYSTSFISPLAWEGVSLWGWSDIKEGDVVRFGVKASSSNARIQLWSDGVDILGFENGTGAREKTITIPASTTGFDFVIVTNTASTEISITDIYAYKVTLEDNTPSVPDTPPATTTGLDPFPLLGKGVGYRKLPEDTTLASNNVIVSDVTTLQSAVKNAKAGQTIYVKAGTYTINEWNIACAGTENNYITIKNYPNETPVFTNTQIFFNASAKYLNFEGFLLKDLIGDWITCIKVEGGASYLNIRNNEITNIKQLPTGVENSGCNPLVLYGKDGEITKCIVENNYIHDCDTGWAEALTLNGNVTNCQVLQNTIDNCMNIGIDLAGNFPWTGTVGDSTNQSRFNTVARNLVMNCQSPYATSAGLYNDGGRDNTFENNIVYNCQCGVELGAEESGANVENFIVRNNLLIDCGRAIGVGGYQETSATHRNSYIYNNTIVNTDKQDENVGLMLERTSNVNFFNNIVYGEKNFVYFSNSKGLGTDIKKGNNLYYKPLDTTVPAGETGSMYGNPLFNNRTMDLNGEYILKTTSPAINKGVVSDYCGTVDLLGKTRVTDAKIDIGAYEL